MQYKYMVMLYGLPRAGEPLVKRIAQTAMFAGTGHQLPESMLCDMGHGIKNFDWGSPRST